METWILNHPNVGLIEVDKGFDAEFSTHSPSDSPWPQEVPQDSEGNPRTFINLPADASVKERLLGFVENPPVRIRIRMNGDIIARWDSIPNGKASLEKRLKNKLTSPTMPLPGKPCLKFTKSLDDNILMLEYRAGSEVVEFEPPAGSRGAHRRQAMEESAVKRWAYPLLAGLGKGSWALAVLVLTPLLSRFISWLLSFLPDWDLPKLPQPPTIDLPIFTLPAAPSIELPVITLPNWELPGFDIPWWVELILEYRKIWIPIVLGIIFGIIAIRNHKKSEEKKKEWEAAKEL